MVKIDKSLYYNPSRMLSYDRILNFVIGARGIGKSYAFKKFPIKRFIEHGEQFIYVRRYKPELKKITNYFNDVMGEFPDHELKVKGREFYIDGKIAGWAVPLSAWQSEKSNAYPNVRNMIFDEFIREKDGVGYLQNEVESLLNFMDTVFRTRDNTRCICLSNSVTVVNPYFTYFNLVPNTNKRFNAYRGILVEIPDSADFAEQRKQTRFGQLIDGTDYGEMSLYNEFVNDSNTFISRRTKSSKFIFSIAFKGMTLGVWYDSEVSMLFMSQDHDPQSKNVYAMTTDDLKDNNLLIMGWKKHGHLLQLARAFTSGVLRFDNQVIRTLGYEMFKKMNIQ